MHSYRGEARQTRSVPRCVNPKWGQSMHFAALNFEDRLEFQVMDVELVSQSAQLPVVIASTTVEVGKDLEGYIELLAPEIEEENGNPVLHVSMKFYHFPDPDADREDVQECGSAGVTQECGSAGVSSQSPWKDMEASAPPPTEGCGSAGDPGVAHQAVRHASSPFWIDLQLIQEEIVTANKTPMKNLAKKQGSGMLYPLPPTLEGNYLPLGIGWNPSVGDWEQHLLWEDTAVGTAVDKELLDEVLTSMKKLAEDLGHPQWCEGVRVCLKFLEHVKASRCNQSSWITMIVCKFCGGSRGTSTDHVWLIQKYRPCLLDA